MRLVDLEPRWLLDNGEKVGFVFRSPSDQKWFQSCMFKKVPFREQCKLLNAIGLTGGDDDWPKNVQTCNPDCAWTHDTDDFATISVTPSLDGSQGGLWHGYITKGEIV
jgi:hypothetical protein